MTFKSYEVEFKAELVSTYDLTISVLHKVIRDALEKHASEYKYLVGGCQTDLKAILRKAQEK
jgi:hypothetical protein